MISTNAKQLHHEAKTEVEVATPRKKKGFCRVQKIKEKFSISGELARKSCWKSWVQSELVSVSGLSFFFIVIFKHWIFGQTTNST